MGRRQQDRLRAMYTDGRGNATARRYARFWNRALRSGLLPRRWVILEVPGRHSGRLTRFPLGMADLDGQWFVVSMLGECNWTRNARAAGGTVTLRRRRARHAILDEVPVDRRAPIIQRYLQKVPGARAHIPVDPEQPVQDFAAIARNYPVFHVTPVRPQQ